MIEGGQETGPGAIELQVGELVLAMRGVVQVPGIEELSDEPILNLKVVTEH